MEIFDYDNILLLPRKCRVESRSECDASVELGPRRFRLPVVPANMKTVVSEDICIWMAKNDYFYVMHRFDLDNVKFVQEKKLITKFLQEISMDTGMVVFGVNESIQALESGALETIMLFEDIEIVRYEIKNTFKDEIKVHYLNKT